jgi:FKBP-type peptidyl-prolyl cis-trans isomerase
MRSVMRAATVVVVLAGGVVPTWAQATQTPAPATPPAPPAAAPAAPQAQPATPPVPEALKRPGIEVEAVVPIAVDVMGKAPPWAIKADATPVNREEKAGGLVVEDFEIGTGPEARPDTTVVVQSRGYFADGKEFDSTYISGTPIVAPLGSAIPGIRDGIAGMRVGGKRRLSIPAALAYGDRGSPPKESGRPQIIPPNADLKFDIYLVDILQIEDLKVGEGEAVRFGATVKAHYVGTLAEDGTEFDSSYKRGQPLEFPLRQVIPGWQYGLQGMKPGGKRRLHVPWTMAYGDRGMPGSIPPRANLVFEIELLEVRNVPPPPATAPAAPAPAPSGG